MCHCHRAENGSACQRPRPRLARKIARCFRGQLDLLGIAGAASPPSFDDDLYPPAARRPHAEMYAAFRQRFRSNGSCLCCSCLSIAVSPYHCSADRS